MLAATNIKPLDENETATVVKQVNNKINGTAGETGKRTALGDLQNRALPRPTATKDNSNKDLKDLKQNTFRSVKSRVDTHWKKPTLTSTGTTKSIKTNNAANGVAQRKVFTRSTSLVNNGVVGLQRLGSTNQADRKAKTLTTIVVENKIQKGKVTKTGVKSEITGIKKATTNTASLISVDPSLRREDSNLSLKSLSKLRAVITNQNLKIATTQTKPNKVESHKNDYGTFSSKLLDQVKDIDSADGDNLILVSEYVNSIYNYLFQLEEEQPVRVDHLNDQVEIYAKMRAVLIDWINEVHLQFHLAGETFQMAVSLIDRYLQVVKNTKRTQLQLVGVTALFLAAKYEELYPPQINDFVYITDDTYTCQQMRLMELQMFKVLNYNLSRPQPIQFLRRFSKAAEAEDNHHAMAKYFLELVMVEYELAHYKPSEIAAASLFLALNLLKQNIKLETGFNDNLWTTTLVWYSRYNVDHLKPIAVKIAKIAHNAPNAKLKSVYSKYQSSKFQKVSARSELYSPLMESIIKYQQ